MIKLKNLLKERMPRIKRICADPCVSASSMKSVFYRTPPIIDDDKKPRINADEHRFVNMASAIWGLLFQSQIEGYENHPD